MTPLIDPFGRAITYLRVSVTDRCDLRCIYCMSARMRFLPRADLLTLEELDRIFGASAMGGGILLRDGTCPDCGRLAPVRRGARTGLTLN